MVLQSGKGLLFIAVVAGLVVISILSSQHALADNVSVVIPPGAANPNFDTPAAEWFSPSVISIRVGDTVTWTNHDREIHNIASGTGITRMEFVTSSNVGTTDGLFQSGPLAPGESWSQTFSKAGVFHYFCTIHPWMNGAVVVNERIPTVPTDASGAQITKWPVEEKTLDGLYEADLAWEPHVILTGQRETLVYQFYNGITGRLIESGVPYELVIYQNGKEIFRVDDNTQIGGGYRYFTFDQPGAVTFRFQKIGGGSSFADFSSLVYQNPNATQAGLPVIQPARNVALGQAFAAVFIVPPLAVMALVFIWAKWGSSIRSKMPGKKHMKTAVPPADSHEGT